MSQKTPSPTGEEEHTTEETNPPQTTKRGPETADPAHPHTTGTHQAHQKRGKTNGIDFWHAVEFSRIRRAPHQAFRPSVGATVCCCFTLLGPRRGTQHGQVKRLPGLVLSCCGGREPTLAGLVGRSPAPSGAIDPRDEARCLEEGQTR